VGEENKKEILKENYGVGVKICPNITLTKKIENIISSMNQN